jgi:hypothetical protein
MDTLASISATSVSRRPECDAESWLRGGHREGFALYTGPWLGLGVLSLAPLLQIFDSRQRRARPSHAHKTPADPKPVTTATTHHPAAFQGLARVV